MALIGVETVIVTNAAGGINRNFSPGDIILITGHINLMRDISLDAASRIQGSEDVYDPTMRKQAACAAAEVGVTLKTGVYAAVTGPSYETPAEIRALRFLGADMVGMSTVPEATEAKRLGMKVLGFSFIANPAAGLNRNPLSHHDIIETSARHLPVFKTLLKRVIRTLQDHPGAGR